MAEGSRSSNNWNGNQRRRYQSALNAGYSNSQATRIANGSLTRDRQRERQSSRRGR